jgi:hypothetical protein
VIHYHGTPITPRAQLERMAGRAFCVPFSDSRDSGACLRIGSAVMFDNGAFSAFTRGAPFDEAGYCAWVEPMLVPPHWAVVPDVIGGPVEAQRAALARWPYPKELSAPVWHLGLPLDWLLELADHWPRVCLGSSAQFWQVGAPAWQKRMALACNALARSRRWLPWLHGLRMLGQGLDGWPLASVDSAGLAQNYKRDTGCAECKAAALAGRMRAPRRTQFPEQMPLC